MKALLAVALIATSLTMSCKKESSDKTANGQGRLSKIVYTSDNEAPSIETFTYDEKGRLKVYINDNFRNEFTFNSASMLVVKRISIPDNKLVNTVECTLNDQGAVTKLIKKNQAGIAEYTYTYAYNALGYMVSRKGVSSSDGFSEFFTMDNGNIVSCKRTFTDGAVYTTQYAYHPKTNNIPGNIAGYWQSAELFGKASSNLLKEIKMFDGNGKLSTHITMDYLTNENNQVTRIEETNQKSGEKSVYQYSYN